MEASHGARLTALEGRMRPLLRRVPARALRLPVIPGRGRLLRIRDSGRERTLDRRRHDVDSLVSIESYWLRLRSEEGPAVSVFFEPDESMRIDLLPSDPHLHYHRTTSMLHGAGDQRVYLAADDNIATQLERAEYELRRNVAFSLHLDRRRRVRRHHLDPASLDRAVTSAIEHLAGLVADSAPPSKR